MWRMMGLRLLFAVVVTVLVMQEAWSGTEGSRLRPLPKLVSYPEATPRYLPAIQETVPVYAGKIRLMRDLSLGMVQELGQEEGGIGLEGAFRYQACDEKVCYPPRTVPLKWTFRLEGLESRRRINTFPLPAN